MWWLLVFVGATAIGVGLCVHLILCPPPRSEAQDVRAPQEVRERARERVPVEA